MLDALHLVDELEHLIEQTPAQGDSEQTLHGDRWIIRSALQKAVRRGQATNALGLAKALGRTDAQYLWHSLAVIAVEDIGLGWIDGLTYTTACTLKTVRQEAIKGKSDGEARLLAALIERLCAVPKHRGCCELSLAVECGQRGRLMDMDRWPTEQLVDAVGSDDANECYAALLVLKGSSRGILRRPRDDAGLKQAEDIIADRLNEQPLMARAAIHGLRRPCDSMSLAILPVLKMASDVGLDRLLVVDETPCWPRSATIGGFAGETFDVHTRDGKIALKALYTSMAKHHKVISKIDPLRAVKALGAVVFIVEGSLVDRRIAGPGFEGLREAQDYAFMASEGVPDAYVPEVKELVRANIDLLNSKRRWVLGEAI